MFSALKGGSDPLLHERARVGVCVCVHMVVAANKSHCSYELSPVLRPV